MSSTTALTQVTVVHSPACHFCEEAQEVLESLARQHPLTVRAVDIASEEGGQLVAHHRPAMSPLVLVDGQFFSAGRFPRKKFLKHLASTGAVR